jgi:hypothetical protein
MIAEQLAAFRRMVNAHVRFVVDGYPAPDEWHQARDALNGVFNRPHWPALQRCTEQRLRALGLTSTEVDARGLAISHIRPSVERGDSIGSIVSGNSGSWSVREGVTVGGSRCDIHRKQHSGRIVHVTCVNGLTCCYEFNLERLIKEIQESAGARQMVMF